MPNTRLSSGRVENFFPRSWLPEAEVSANSLAHVLKPINKRELACEAILKRNSFPSSRQLVKDHSLHNVRLQPIDRSHRQLKLCSDASAAATNLPSGSKGLQVKSAVETQPKAGRKDLSLDRVPMIRPPWKVGKVASYAPLPPLKLGLSERYQQQPDSPRLLRLKADRGQAVKQAKLPKDPSLVTSSVKTPKEARAPQKKNHRSSNHQNCLLPTITNISHPQRGVRQKHNPFTLQGSTTRPPNPRVLDLYQMSVPLHLPGFPYTNIHLMLPTVCCSSSLHGGDQYKHQPSPSESEPEYESDYEDDFESAYESDTDVS